MRVALAQRVAGDLLRVGREEFRSLRDLQEVVQGREEVRRLCSALRVHSSFVPASFVPVDAESCCSPWRCYGSGGGSLW